jgi:ATP-dependent DNA ligase
LASPDFTKHLAYCANGTKIALNATYDGDGAVIYEHAYTLGCEGIVSKRLGSPYCAGRTDQWLKMKNPKAPALRREREIDWAKR